MREFDLNIERVLENWEPYHAVREIIANALDEQTLTGTKPIEIFKDVEQRWHIRDYGRGLQYQHFTQNENDEKLRRSDLIGKFGVGLKDALATFDRHKIGVEIYSRFGKYTTGQTQKRGFSDLMTLHVYIEAPEDTEFEGTEFIIGGCANEEVERAKSLFLQYAKLVLLDATSFGEVYRKWGEVSEIFVNGIKVAEEENFLFSYNITSLNTTLRKAINRERTNVGRGAYSERVKDILLKCTSEAVVSEFVENLRRLSGGEQSDELRWKDVQIHFLQTLSKQDDVVFVTSEQVNEMSGRKKEIVDDSEKKKVFVSQDILDSLKQKAHADDFKVNTVDSVVEDYKQSFQYDFVDVNKLTVSERRNFELTQAVIERVFPEFNPVRVLISTTMRPDQDEDDTVGICENFGERIIILREVLKYRPKFLGVLAHELIHARTGYLDCSREFETVLTEEIGKLLAERLH